MIQIVPGPFLFPQRCFFTGDQTPDREVLDTGHTDNNGGRVYIAMHYMDELAKAAGYTTRAEYADIVKENEELKAQLAVLPAALERASNAIRDISASAVLDLLVGGADDDVPVVEVRPEEPQRPRKAAQGSAAAAVEQGRPSL